jgi:hypothetical protein
MDEITMFRSLRPEAPTADDADAIRAAARERLAGALDGAQAPGRRPVTWLPVTWLPVTGRAVTGRAGRWRWRLPAAVATAACAAVALALVLSGGGPATGKTPHRVSIVTADWSIKWNPSGTVTIRLLQAEADLTGLQQTLQSEGINAIAKVIPMKAETVNGRMYRFPQCSYNNLSQVSLPQWQAIVTSTTPGGPGWTFVIHPSAMPAGSALYFQEYSLHTVNMGTINVGFQFTALTSDVLPACTPNAPGWQATAQPFPLPLPSGSALASPPPSS